MRTLARVGAGENTVVVCLAAEALGVSLLLGLGVCAGGVMAAARRGCVWEGSGEVVWGLLSERSGSSR